LPHISGVADATRMMLPGWVVDNQTSVQREAAEYRHMSQSEKAKILASLCRWSAKQLALRSDRQQLLDYRDPLPESSRAALARLRKG
jgi:phosphopantetheinyl transferase